MTPVLRKNKECCSGGSSDSSCCSGTDKGSGSACCSSESSTGCCSTADSDRMLQTSSELTLSDHCGAFKARWGIGRMKYTVAPGLYSLGTPHKTSPVFVSANYKLSFDTLRKNLKGIDCYILVIDTDGINVWCAAGKGTFGTDEIVNRINETCLEKITDTREIILPQLGAPGVSAHEVKKLTGFKVIYGPVRAEDISAFHKNGNKATPEMRKVKFTLYDRTVLIPVELVIGLKKVLILCISLFIISGLNRDGFSLSQASASGGNITFDIMLAFLCGTVLGPVLLPLLPGRAFAVKGIFTGLISFLIAWSAGLAGAGTVEMAGSLLLMTAISSFTVMNFTGASTYTSLSGVQKEMKIAIPFQAVGLLAGIVIWIITLFQGKGV